MAPFKISDLIMFRGRKLQFFIMQADGPTKLLDALKVDSRMTHIKNTMQATDKALKSWTVMAGKSKCEMEHDEENSDKGNDEQSDDDGSEHCDDNN